MRTTAVAALFLLAAAPLSAQSTPTAKPAAPAALTWGPAPAVFPAGARMAVVSGDPGKPGMFTVELKLPAGYKIPPHFHPTDETVEVKDGLFLYGMGDMFDAAKTSPMKPGEKGTIPAKMHHFATAKVATVIDVTAMGPFAMTYVNPANDPTQMKP
jgi:hypothetical protein